VTYPREGAGMNVRVLSRWGAVQMSSVVNADARPVTPLGILVEHLQTAVQMVESEPSVSVR